MKTNDRVLVVGTTTDYVDWIRTSRPGKALFLTDSKLRAEAVEPQPDAAEEICCDLGDFDKVASLLLEHLAHYEMGLAGIACFDCENMLLTADLADRHGLSYPTADAISNSRNKSISKQLWRQADVPCPKFQAARTAEEAKEIAQRLAGPCVLKPLSGAGSELTFCCDNPTEVQSRFVQVQDGLSERCHLPMFNQLTDGADTVLIEEWLDGVEYSCDFIVDQGIVNIVRMTRKHRLSEGPFGITSAYELLQGTGPFDAHTLCRYLAKAATALGLAHAFCMTDMIDRDRVPHFLEMTPRPGGDCLPWLLREAAGVDVLDLYLDFSCGRLVNSPIHPQPRVAVRIFADRNGVFEGVDTDTLLRDPRVKEVYVKRRHGEQVDLPPVDYDSWILGHILYEPAPGFPIAQQNRELVEMINVNWTA